VIDAVFFDGDQTLWDFQKVMHAALMVTLGELQAARPGPLSRALRIHDLRVDRDTVARELEGEEYDLARLRQLGFARTIERLSPYGHWTAAENETLIEELTASYFRHRDSDPALFEDTLPGLEALKTHYRLGLLSNGSRLPQDVGLDGYFETIVFAQDHRVNKPDPELFTIARNFLQVEASHCVLIGDHPLNDVVGAKRSGWKAIWIDREYSGHYKPPEGYDEQPDAVITSLLQLPEILQSL
jgi:HAD superfamily hydrolase (TIGR01549 family)